MATSKFKASFMLDQELLDHFATFLQEMGKLLEPTSKYQVARIQIQSAEVLVYRSGIIIFEDAPEVKTVIEQFISDQDLDIHDFERYQSVETEEVPAADKQGWDETPKGVWLTEDQVQVLITKLEQELELQPGEKHERGRFIRDQETLVINSNGVVYTIGGFEGILNLLKEVIEEINPYKDYERLVIVDEQGRWERLGPVVLVICDVMVPDAISLQLRGIKDDSLSRGTDHVELMPVIEEFSSYQSHLLTPETINTKVSDREEYREYISNEFQEYIQGQLLNLNEATLLVIDSHLSDMIDHEHTMIISRDDRWLPVLGVSSTVSNALVEKWTEDWYQQLGFQVERHNLDKVKSSSQVSKLAKQFLL